MALSRYLKIDFKRALSLRFIIALLMFIFIRYISIRGELELMNFSKAGSLVYYISFVLSEMFLGVFAALTIVPFGEAYSQDINTGFIRYQIYRGDKKSFILSKQVVFFMSSFILSLIAYILVYIFLAFFVPVREGNKLYFNTAPFIIYSLEESRPLLMISILVVLKSLYLTYLASLSFLANLYYSNKLLLYMLPSLFTQIFYKITKKFDLSISAYELQRGYMPGNNPTIAIVSAIGLMLAYIFIAQTIIYLKMKRDIDDL